MAVVYYYEHGLNVSYHQHMFENAQADDYFEQLKSLPFYTPTLKIRGKDVTPKRKILAYGDDGLNYSFTGAEIRTEAWTPLLLELRHFVEKQVGCAYNYVLLNYYSDGNDYISHHKDNESNIDTTFPIAVLSFGEKRILEFKKAGCEPVLIELHHGSLYTMMKPTNEQFTHGIAPDANAKNPRISLTFRHLLQPTFPAMKKQRLNVDLLNPTSEKQNEHFTKTVSQPSFSEVLPYNDWMDQHFQKMNTPDPLLAEYPLQYGTYLQITLENNIYLRVHIRQFKETKIGSRFPTKQGVMLSIPTWDHFQGKIFNFNFYSVNDSFVANNQLLVSYIDSEYCYLQQIFQSRDKGFFFKPPGIKLSKDQMLKIGEMEDEISVRIINIMLTKHIPNVIQNRPSVCTKHCSEEQTKQHFLLCLQKEIEVTVGKFFTCMGCVYSHPSQFRHDCMMKTMKEKFYLNRKSVLLNFNVFAFAKQACQECSCNFTNTFFETLNNEFYDDYLENLFQ